MDSMICYQIHLVVIVMNSFRIVNNNFIVAPIRRVALLQELWYNKIYIQ